MKCKPFPYGKDRSILQRSSRDLMDEIVSYKRKAQFIPSWASTIFLRTRCFL